MIWLIIAGIVIAGGLIAYCCVQKCVKKDIQSLREYRDKLIKECHRLSDENDLYVEKHIELEEKYANLQMECDSWEHKMMPIRYWLMKTPNSKPIQQNITKDFKAYKMPFNSNRFAQILI